MPLSSSILTETSAKYWPPHFPTSLLERVDFIQPSGIQSDIDPIFLECRWIPPVDSSIPYEYKARCTYNTTPSFICTIS